MNFHPIRPVINARSNFKFDLAWNSGQIGLKFTEINCLPAWSNWVSSLWITPNLSSISCPVKLGIIPINGFTPNSIGHEILLKMGVNSLRLIVCLPGRIGYHSNEFTPILSSISCPVEFDRAWNTAQNGSKSIDLLPIWAVFQAWSNWVSSQWIYTQFEQYFRPGQIGYHSNKFTPILSSISCPVEFEIRLVKFNRVWNTAQKGSKSIELLPIWVVFQAWLNWVSSQWIYSHFEQYFMPGRIWPGMKYCSIWVEIHGFTPNLSSISGLVELGIIPMNLLPFWTVFHARSNSTGRIRPGMKYW